MAFDIDVLVIFADRDNETVSATQSGWVTQFKNFLEVMLAQVLGKKPHVMLKGEFDTLTSPRLDNNAVLITILTSDFIKSPHCKGYLDTFYSTAHRPGERVFKVLKSPVPVQQQPEVLRDLPNYEMFQLDPGSGEIKEYSDYFSSDAERQYWMEIVDLSYDIQEVLTGLTTQVSAPVKTFYKRKTIFLAETSHELSVQRNIILRELRRLGYTVLPSKTLPGLLPDLESVVRKDLDASSMAIHLIGSSYGDIPEGSDKSVQEIQNRIAAERALSLLDSKQEFSRLIWITPDVSNIQEKQEKFIETLRRDVETQEGTEILQTLLEDFKNIIREELEEASEKKLLDDTSGRAIYFIHDKGDEQKVKPYIDLISNSGFQILVPSFEGDLLELRDKHIENLRNLDGAIIYKSEQVNEQWVRMKALDLLKAPGFGRKKPILAKAVVTEGKIENKEPLKSQNLRVIEGDLQQSLESVRSFLQQFNA